MAMHMMMQGQLKMTKKIRVMLSMTQSVRVSLLILKGEQWG